MKTPEEYIKPIMDTFKQPRDGYSEYNAGWIDACGEFYDVIEQVIADTQADTKERLEAIERRSKEVDAMLDGLLSKLNRV